jgi:putative phage-type endonuclease
MSITDRKQWLAERRQGIGASDAPTVVGVRTEPSRFRLWCDKRGTIEPDPPNEAMQWGLRLEPAISEAFQERTGLEVCRHQVSLVHRDLPWMRATLDGVFGGAREGIVEFKACGSWSARKLPEDGDSSRLPEPWIIQAQHQLAVSHERLAIFAVFADMSLRLYEVERDDVMIAEIIRLEEAFWRHVTDGTPPAEFGPADVQTIGKYFNRDDAPEVTLNPLQYGKTVAGYRDALTAIKNVEAARDRYKSELLMAMGDAGTANCGPYTLKRKIVQTKERTQVIKASQYVRFTINNGAEDE